MPEAAGEAKSPRTTRRLRPADKTTPPPPPPRQVRFEEPKSTTASAASVSAATATATASAPAAAPVAQSNQPDSFPALAGAAWFTAADPTRSISFAPPFHVPNACPAPFYPQNLGHQHHVTFIGHYPSSMPDYANAGPPPMGVNFQPPVPDTTFGPIPHLYVPRFDAAPQGVHPPQAAAVGQPSYLFAPSQQGFVPQGQQQQQPVMINGQAYYPASPTVPGPGQSFVAPAVVQGAVPVVVPAVPGQPTAAFMTGTGNGPDVSLGRTPNEEMLCKIQFAHQNKLFEPQEFKPGDDDPSRFYYVREVDGNWTQRNRYTIDRMSCRWYVTDEGWFYAVRLPD